jgi:hypothetical protein
MSGRRSGLGWRRYCGFVRARRSTLDNSRQVTGTGLSAHDNESKHTHIKIRQSRHRSTALNRGNHRHQRTTSVMTRVQLQPSSVPSRSTITWISDDPCDPCISGATASLRRHTHSLPSRVTGSLGPLPTRLSGETGAALAWRAGRQPRASRRLSLPRRGRASWTRTPRLPRRRCLRPRPLAPPPS